MKKIYLLLLFLGAIVCCCNSDLRNKSHHCGTSQISNTLYIESYLIWSGGATSGDCVSEYITDSTTFRKYITTVLDHYWPVITVNGDSIIVDLNNYCTPVNDQTLIFSIKQLQQEGIWE